MKRICCSRCREEIGHHDFFMRTKGGKICSDCLVKEAPVQPDAVHLFKQGGPKDKKAPQKEKGGIVIALPLNEAL